VIKAVIFDIDGTLVDSVDLHARAWKNAFKRFGRDVPFEQVRRQIGKGGDQLMPVFFSKEELERFGKQIEEYRGELYKRVFLPRVKPFPKVRDLLWRIKTHGRRIVLASSAEKDEMQNYKKLARIEDLVAEESSGDQVEKSKPHPDIFAVALRQLGDATRHEVMVVGDTPYDAEAAGQLNLRTIGVLSGGFTEADLRDAGCIAVFRDPAHLLEMYNHSPLA
jgi:phosphoglycolate phosphatase-like HAD superfamily hydrolase